MHLIVTASATLTGQPLYRTAQGSWSPRLADSATFDAQPAAERELERARTEQAEVCDPYCFEASIEDAQLRPNSLREQIRAHGPTVDIL